MLRPSKVDFRCVNLMPLPFSAAFSFNHRCDVCVFNLQLTWKHIRILKSLIKVAGTISADTVGAIYRSFWIFWGKHISRCQHQVSLTKHKH